MDWDFGFTVIAAPESPITDRPVGEPAGTPGEILELRDALLIKLADIERKLEVLEVGGDSFRLMEEHRLLIAEQAKEKLHNLEVLILPLLYNLQKNSEKEYIHWPNREKIIQAQIEKILLITRSYD